MTRTLVVGLTLIATLASPSAAQTTAAEDAAQKAAESFLALVDAAKYAESWQQAATMFKAAVTADQWGQAVGKARGAFGAFKSRTVTSRKYSTSLPGAPDGQYVVVTFESAFERKAAAVETAVMVLDKDGAWRVSGSFIR